MSTPARTMSQAGDQGRGGHNKLDLTGQVFGRLTVIGEAGRDKGKRVRWLCRCGCGTERIVASGNLRAGRTQSCGCYGREVSAERLQSHGQVGTPLYRRWKGMIKRTSDPNSAIFRYYGGRGITVCDRWKSFENFAADMGSTFREELTIDRIDVNGPYSPDNCRWIPLKEQQRNRRSNRHLVFNGRSLTVAEWSEITGLNYETIRSRLGRGWSVERALTVGADSEALAAILAANTTEEEI